MRKLVIIADSSPTARALLKQEFDAEQFETIEAVDGEEAIRLAIHRKPTIVTVSLMLPKKDGIEVCSAITSNASTSNTTVIMITSSNSTIERARAFEAGAVRFLCKGFPRGGLAEYVSEIISAPKLLADSRILVVDDSRFIRTTIAHLLEAEGADVIQADDGMPALQSLQENSVDVILTDYHMPEMNGIAFVQELRGIPDHTSTPVLFLTAAEDRNLAARALNAGANDFIQKPFEGTELLARIRSFARMAQLTKQLQHMALTDELTGLLNRRHAMNKLAEQFAAAKRYGNPCTCIMLDIDHFKKFNDTHGHDVGDIVLRQTAEILQANVRSTDSVCRLGGEEFLVLCPHVDMDGAMICAEKLRSSVEQGRFTHDGTPLTVTMSLGVAEFDREMTDEDALLKAADEALYASKEAGRNRVTSSCQISC